MLSLLIFIKFKKATEGRNILLAEEVEAIKAGLEQLRVENVKIERGNLELPQVDGVPEELFRRFHQRKYKKNIISFWFIFVLGIRKPIQDL